MKTGKRAGAQTGSSSGAAVDWRLLPKGSPERKAAVSEERRKLIAAARAAKAAKAGSSATSASSEVDAEGGTEQAPAGEAKLSYRELIEWVWEHLGEARCPAVPNRMARELWRYAKKNRDGFLDKYVPVLLKAEKEPDRKPTEQEVMGNSIEYYRTWWNSKGYGDPPNDWAKDYQDARHCPLDEECPALKAAIEQRKREFEQGRGPLEELNSRQLPINQRIANAKRHLEELLNEKTALEIKAASGLG